MPTGLVAVYYAVKVSFYLFSTNSQHELTDSQASPSVVRRPSTLSNNFSETTRLVETEPHIHPLDWLVYFASKFKSRYFCESSSLFVLG